MTRVLIVEDDIELATMITDCLESSGYTVKSVANGRDGLQIMLDEENDVIILDWELPYLQGTTACKKFREKNETTPVLMLTGRSHISDKEQGFDVGADDYLTKPFELKELVLRIRALLKRAGNTEQELLKFDDVEIDRRSRTVRKAGRDVHLFRVDFELLLFLATNERKVFSPEALLDFVYDSGATYTADAIRSSIKRIRQKLDTAGSESCIKTVHGVGYKFEIRKHT